MRAALVIPLVIVSFRRDSCDFKKGVDLFWDGPIMDVLHLGAFCLIERCTLFLNERCCIHLHMA